MRGMLMKDFQLIRHQKSFLIMLAAICTLVLATTDMDELFLIPYATMLISFLTVGTITYDENDNGAAYLFTMPVSRRGYVREKYLFIVGAAAAGWLISLLVVTAVLLYRGRISDWGEHIFVVVIYLVIAVVFLSLAIPLQLKFGAEKSRSAMGILVGCGMLAAFAAVKFLEMSNIDLDGIVTTLAETRAGVMYALELAVCVALYAVSYRISCRIQEKKEF